MAQNKLVAVNATRIQITPMLSVGFERSGTVLITNVGSNPVRLGGALVEFSGTGGYLLAAGSPITLDIGPHEALFAICNTAQTSSLDMLFTGA